MVYVSISFHSYFSLPEGKVYRGSHLADVKFFFQEKRTPTWDVEFHPLVLCHTWKITITRTRLFFADYQRLIIKTQLASLQMSPNVTICFINSPRTAQSLQMWPWLNVRRFRQSSWPLSMEKRGESISQVDGRWINWQTCGSIYILCIYILIM